jgi:hypothetical protein
MLYLSLERPWIHAAHGRRYWCCYGQTQEQRRVVWSEAAIRVPAAAAQLSEGVFSGLAGGGPTAMATERNKAKSGSQLAGIVV